MNKMNIVIVEDEEKFAKLTADSLTDDGYQVSFFVRPGDALTFIKKNGVDLVITDLKMELIDGIGVLKQVKEFSPEIDVVIMTAHGTVKTAVEALKTGAYDYILKPFGFEELTLLVKRIEEKRKLYKENIRLRRQIRRDFSINNIVGESPVIRNLKEVILKVAGKDTTVLIRGASGTGKELIARAIHGLSPRSLKPFLAINCSAFTATLLESELFGHEKGAFTGAVKTKPGLFEEASGGTLLLDEIGDMDQEIQAKLLRSLQEKEIRRVGGNKMIPVDVRVISATNRNLEEAIREKTFREDLYFRLNVFPIHVPALNERNEDIEILIDHFLRKQGHGPEKIDKKTRQKLRDYSWPGNIRELENMVERLVLLSGPDPVGIHMLPDNIMSPGGRRTFSFEIPTEGIVLEEVEREFIFSALKKANWNKTMAAKLLGITRRTLYSRLEKMAIVDQSTDPEGVQS